MPTSSIRLSENIKRAVKHSSYSISELAREGIEEAIIDDFVSVCWICGGGIHINERRVTINQKVFIQKYAYGDLTDELRQLDQSDYTDYFEIEARKNQSGAAGSDRYFEHVSRRLNMPESQHVDFCSSCAEYLDQIRERGVASTNIPVPYYYREKPDGDRASSYTADPYLIVNWYVAEAIAVNCADYFFHQRAIFNNKDLSRADRQFAQFWWAARARNERIISSDSYPLAEIAVWSHAESLWTGNPLEPIYSLALDRANKKNRNPPTVGDDPLPIELDPTQLKVGSACPACGCETDMNSNTYCETCLFAHVNCPTKGCDSLFPKIQNKQITESSVKLCCETCNYSQSPSEEYASAIKEKFQPVFNEIERTIPFYN